jgi:hypothetical protein
MDIFHIWHYGCVSVSFIATPLLFYLIFKHSTRDMSVYRWFIFYLSATDILTAIVYFLPDFTPYVFDPPLFAGKNV